MLSCIQSNPCTLSLSEKTKQKFWSFQVTIKTFGFFFSVIDILSWWLQHFSYPWVLQGLHLVSGLQVEVGYQKETCFFQYSTIQYQLFCTCTSLQWMLRDCFWWYWPRVFSILQCKFWLYSKSIYLLGSHKWQCITALENELSIQ